MGKKKGYEGVYAYQAILKIQGILADMSLGDEDKLKNIRDVLKSYYFEYKEFH